MRCLREKREHERKLQKIRQDLPVEKYYGEIAEEYDPKDAGMVFGYGCSQERPRDLPVNIRNSIVDEADAKAYQNNLPFQRTENIDVPAPRPPSLSAETIKGPQAYRDLPINIQNSIVDEADDKAYQYNLPFRRTEDFDQAAYRLLSPSAENIDLADKYLSESLTAEPEEHPYISNLLTQLDFEADHDAHLFDIPVMEPLDYDDSIFKSRIMEHDYGEIETIAATAQFDESTQDIVADSCENRIPVFEEYRAAYDDDEYHPESESDFDYEAGENQLSARLVEQKANGKPKKPRKAYGPKSEQANAKKLQLSEGQV